MRTATHQVAYGTMTISTSRAVDVEGRLITKENILGVGLAIETRHQNIQVFFIGIGDDGDLDVAKSLRKGPAQNSRA